MDAHDFQDVSKPLCPNYRIQFRSQNRRTYTSQIRHLDHSRSHITISSTKEQPEPIGTNFSGRTQKDDIATLPLILACAWVGGVAVVAQRFVRVRWHHELTRAALENFRRLVFVEDDVAGGVVAVVHPPRGGLSTGTNKLRH